MKLLSVATALTLCACAAAKVWTLSEDLQGAKLLQAFYFEEGAGADNGGVADYASLVKSRARGLLSVSAKTGWTTLKTSMQPATPAGNRYSIRMSSKTAYNVGSMFVFDVTHMPTGCGNWPAIWAVGYDWPSGGEVDIVEGVHATSQNLMSSHTTAGCIQQRTGFTGTFSMVNTTLQNVCDVVPTENQGCGVRDPRRNSFGAPFNQAQGGVFVLQWDTEGLRTYFFTRSAIPADITARAPNPANWGTPANFVSSTNCSMDYFSNLRMVVNTNLCGTWGAGVWSQDLSYAGQVGSCAARTGYATCEAYVRAVPGAFRQSYWTFRSIQVYH